MALIDPVTFSPLSSQSRGLFITILLLFVNIKYPIYNFHGQHKERKFSNFS